MNRPYRVLVVDDSALFRLLISEILSSAVDLQVIGTARDAQSALDKVVALKPDVMTLDIEMPEISGLELLAKVRRLVPLPVVMVSGSVDIGDRRRSAAVASGAFDIIQKPTIDFRSGMAALGDRLITKVRQAARSRLRSAGHKSQPASRHSTSIPATHSVRTLRLGRPSTASPPSRVPSGHAPGTRSAWSVRALPARPDPSAAASMARSCPRHVSVLGASTGGTDALLQVLQALPSAFGPVVVVQHMQPKFLPAFADRLNQHCSLRVTTAQDRAPLVDGTVFIAPGGAHTRIAREQHTMVLRVKKGPPFGLHCPAVDELFVSCAKHVGRYGVGVLLTGMGSDGATGMEHMHNAGAVTIAQDEASCVVFGMPRAAIQRGAATYVLPLSGIAAKLTSVTIASRHART